MGIFRLSWKSVTETFRRASSFTRARTTTARGTRVATQAGFCTGTAIVDSEVRSGSATCRSTRKPADPPSTSSGSMVTGSLATPISSRLRGNSLPPTRTATTPAASTFGRDRTTRRKPSGVYHGGIRSRRWSRSLPLMLSATTGTLMFSRLTFSTALHLLQG